MPQINLKFFGCLLAILLMVAGPWSPASKDQKLIFIAAVGFGAIVIQIAIGFARLSTPEHRAYLKQLLKQPVFWLACAATSCFIWVAVTATHSIGRH